MKNLKSLIASALGLTALVTGCTGEMATQEEIASSEEAVCQNREGVNAVLAGLAVAMGKELRRFQPMVDLQQNSSGVIELSAAGKARCGSNCKNTQAMLDMQKWEAHHKVVFPGGMKLDVGVLQSRMQNFFQAQRTCNSRPDNRRGDDCPTEAHDLKFVGTSNGTCGLNFRFHAYKAGTTKPLSYPGQLKNQLLFAGEPHNPFLDFNVIGDDITVDPTGGLVEGDPTASGSCAAVCSKFSATNIGGGCCSCNGVTKKFVRSTFSTAMYLCQ